MVSAIKTREIREALSKAEEEVYGPKDKRVAVLGAFDTWPYMDFISRHLARMGYIAVTSRYIYRLASKRKIARIENEPEPDEFMVDFLWNKVIFKSQRAIIAYSVSGGHYIETDWCYHNHIETLGIALVRKIGDVLSSNQCPDLIVHRKPEFSLCKGSQTAFECIKRSACPFKEQGISKNVIEYFLKAGTPKMVMVAVENMTTLPTLIKKWLNSSLI